MKIPFLQLGESVKELRPEIDSAIARVLDSGWYLLGEELKAFECEWADWCGAEHAVGVSNGLDAMRLVLNAWDIGPGDEVIVPSNTYIATWLAVSHAGATPVAVEPEWESACIDPSLIERAISKRTRAILPVHLYGHPCDMPTIMGIAHRYGLKVLADAAQGHGAAWNGVKIGAHGDAVAWSFYPSKNLGALGDAGAVTSSDPALIERLRKLRNYGGMVRYVNEEIGFNNRLEELHAAVLRIKLRRLKEWNERRHVLAHRYNDAFAGLPGVTLPSTKQEASHAWHLYTLRLPEREALRRHLENDGIGTLIHYPIPPYRQEAYASLKLDPNLYPISDRIHRETISLPINPHLTNTEQDFIIQSVLNFARRN